jgi:ribosomal protein S18 acetylase RimI-like enzyme
VNRPSPISRLFAAVDGSLERVRTMPWGSIVTDPRFPLIHDANYARVDRGEGLSLEDVREPLEPALRAAGAKIVHVATFDPVGSKPLLDDLETEGATFNYDTVMRFAGAMPELRTAHPVKELDVGAPGFWDEQAGLLPEMGVEGDALKQYLDWQRAVLVPFGKRWFGVRDDGRLLGLGALIVHDDVGYVDDVVTAPAARRRGVASAVVAHIVDEAKRSVDEVFLLADEPAPIRLYERLGFVDVGLCVGAVLPLQ